MINTKYVNFTCILIVLMVFDVITTQYALAKYPTVREGNTLMEPIVSSFWIFLAVKAFGVMIIAGMYRRIQLQHPAAAKIGQTVIVFIMLLVVGNNLCVINASALQFNNFTTITGTVANGNGYWDNELTHYNITTHRNIFVVTEPTQITIVEPIGYPLGQSGANGIMSKGNSNLIYGMVASDGYLYYVDSSGIKKKLARSTSNSPYANDTGIGGSSVLIYGSASVTKLTEYDSSLGSALYFIDESTNVVKYFPLSNLVVSTYYTWTPASPGACGGAGFGVYSYAMGNNGFFNFYQNTANNGRGGALMKYNGTLSQVFQGGCSSNEYTPHTSTVFLTPTYIYTNYANTGTIISASHETVSYRNGSLKSTDFYITPLINSNGAYLGGYDTTVMYASGYYTYNVFNFIEPGILYTNTASAALQYQNAFVYTPYATYYNNSIITVKYGLTFSVFPSQIDYHLFSDPTLLYSHSITMLDPSLGSISDKQISDTCTYADAFTLAFAAPTTVIGNCTASGSYTVSTPVYWTPGTYTLRMNELNLSSGINGIVVSNTFNVLNISGTLTTTGGTNSIAEGSSPAAIVMFDNFVSLLGFGINSVSKLLFSLAIITIVGILALWFGKRGDVAALIMFAPYIFFTYIEYIPKWIFIVVIILLAIASKVFR